MSMTGGIIPATLTELALYDNQIAEIRGLDALVNLETLDLGYNCLRKIQGRFRPRLGLNLLGLFRVCPGATATGRPDPKRPKAPCRI